MLPPAVLRLPQELHIIMTSLSAIKGTYIISMVVLHQYVLSTDFQVIDVVWAPTFLTAFLLVSRNLHGLPLCDRPKTNIPIVLQLFSDVFFIKEHGKAYKQNFKNMKWCPVPIFPNIWKTYTFLFRQKLFATTPSRRIKAQIATLSCGLFLTCREK